MSYALVPYLIDGAVLRATCGSKDDDVFDRVAAATTSHPHSDGDSLRAVRAIIDGDLSNPDIVPASYGYGLELMCAGLGTELPVSGALSGISSFWLEDDAREIFAALTRSDFPVQLPFSETGFPGMFFLPLKELNDRLAELNDADLSDREEDVQEGTAEFVAWVREGISSAKDLAVFFY